MEPAGMVHALDLLRGLLKPGGMLIDIHPSGDRPEIWVRMKKDRLFLGYLEETDDFIEYAQAREALEQAVREEMFIVEQRGRFPFITHADSFASLQKFLGEEWKDAVLTPEVIARAESLPGGLAARREILLTEQTDIARLQRKR